MAKNFVRNVFMNFNNKIRVPGRFQNMAFITGMALFALLLFYPLLNPDRCLFSTDDNLGIIPAMKNMMPQGFLSYWSEAPFVGSPGGRVPIMWTPIFLWLAPARFGFNWIHALDLILASVALALFLRAAGLHWPAIVLGVITAFWVGSNLTLTYAGHTGKFAVLMCAAASLYGIRKTFESDRPWLWSIVTGGFVGFMFLEQQDVALFFGLFLGAYALFRSMLQKGMRLKKLLLFIPMGMVVLIMSGAALMLVYSQNVSAVTAQREDDPRQKWEFATQWSWPPEESIDFIAPGYMGWRSHEADGPYWGRMGRSPGWEKTNQGFMNFKLENQYLGAIPVMLALFAVFVALSGFRLYGDGNNFSLGRAGQPVPPLISVGQGCPIIPLTDAKAEIIFWFCAAVLALLLSFGKYFPLYQLFYQLPVMGNIRNPNKFLQVFQLAAGILAAYGTHLIFNWRNVCSDKDVIS